MERTANNIPTAQKTSSPEVKNPAVPTNTPAPTASNGKQAKLQPKRIIIFVCGILISVIACACVFAYFQWQNTTVEGFNQKLVDMGFNVGGMALPYDFGWNGTNLFVSQNVSYIDSTNYFLDINKMNWSFYATEFDGHWFKPAIYWEPHYADSNPCYDFWFSDGSTIYILSNWQYVPTFTMGASKP